MFNKITKKDKRTNLEKEIDSVLQYMDGVSPNTKEYMDTVTNLEVLYKAKALEGNSRVSPDTMAIVACNLIGIVIILAYEKTDIITSKALGFILKGRV